MNKPTKQNLETSTEELALRKECVKAKRIVIKVGTHVLVDAHGHPEAKRIAHLVAQISVLIKSGKEVVLVSSGAIASGIAMLGLKERPRDLDKLQMAAAVGQTGLLDYYRRYFAKSKIIISQVLLTHADLKHRKRHLNARNTVNQLLQHGVIPIVNENDVVAVDEIKIGDNDVLSALMATLIDADLLILLTTPNGLQKPVDETMQRVPYLEAITPAVLNLAFGKTSQLSTGGMKTKLQAAGIALNSAIPVIIASGKQKDVIKNILQGESLGTVIGKVGENKKLRKRKHWISFFHRAEGSVIVDANAAKALRESGKSLLAVGIVAIKDRFSVGALLDILDQTGKKIGMGLTEYSEHELEKIKGHDNAWISEHFSPTHPKVVIHRDNMIVEK